MSFTHCDYCGGAWVHHGTVCEKWQITTVVVPQEPWDDERAAAAKDKADIATLEARSDADAALIERLKKALRGVIAEADRETNAFIEARATLDEAEGRMG